ncbi:MAG: TetR/AcrR family transcriptional regulator [Lactobacillus sp.]|jgi:AcrR family transcriptional regulator|nr:TetR/AcrR family transcriptional regulator [Lactobacillus sp.]
MPSTTFDNLKTDKKNLVTQALLQEFSTYPLAQAQVARIIKTAGISRGAFYKYFTDIEDAYLYLYGTAMGEIHQNIKQNLSTPMVAADYLHYTEAFLDNVANNAYRQLIRLHFMQNEGLVNRAQPPVDVARVEGTPANAWAAMVLTHETLRQILITPELKPSLLAKLSASLQALERIDA